MRIGLITLLLACALVGCTPDDYRRDADLQVGKLVADRKQTTLAYSPRTTVSTQPVAEPTRKSYATIPTSPLPGPTTSPVESAKSELHYSRLGPPEKELTGYDVPGQERFDPTNLRADAELRLRLGPPAAGPLAVIQLDLFKSVKYAVAHSRSYQSAVEDVYLKALDVTSQRHMFEPQPFADVTSGFARTNEPGVTTQANYLGGVDAGVTQHFPLGGSVTARAVLNMIDVLDDHLGDGQTARLALAGSIPLLRGAGMVNLEPLIESERSLIYQIRTFEDFRRQFAVDIASSYFRLLDDQQSINNRRKKFMTSTDLTERTRELYSAGRLNYIEVQRALQTALQDEAALVNAQETYEDALDSFKLQLGMPVDQNVDVEGVELDVRAPQLAQDEALKLALKYRLDLQTAQDQIEDSRRDVSNKRNGLLPDLNVSFSGDLGTSGVNDTNPVLDKHLYDYAASIDLGLPIDRLSERNAYRQSLIGFDRAERNYENVRDGVASDVRGSLRALRNAQLSLEIQSQAIDLAERRLEYSVELLTQGQVTALDVVQAEADLLTAEDGFNGAKADLQIQILTFFKSTGTLRLNPDSGSLASAMDVAGMYDAKNPNAKTGD